MHPWRHGFVCAFLNPPYDKRACFGIHPLCFEHFVPPEVKSAVRLTQIDAFWQTRFRRAIFSPSVLTTRRLVMMAGQTDHHSAPDWNTSTTVGLIAMKSCLSIQVLQEMNPSTFGDLHTFPLGATSRSMFPSYTVKYSFSIPAGRIDTDVCSDTNGPFSPRLNVPPPSPQFWHSH